MKGSPKLPKMQPQQFLLNGGFVQNCPNVIITKYLGYFCNKTCCQELSKIAQSGHTDWATATPTFLLLRYEHLPSWLLHSQKSVLQNCKNIFHFLPPITPTIYASPQLHPIIEVYRVSRIIFQSFQLGNGLAGPHICFMSANQPGLTLPFSKSILTKN